MIACVFAIGGTAHATTTWTGAAGDSRWDNPLNWTTGVPVGGTGSSARAFINDGGGAGVPFTVLIDSATTAVSGRLILSDNLGSDDGTINMTGGTLTVAQGITGAGEQSMHLGSVGRTIFNQTGGVVNLYGQLRQGADSTGGPGGPQGILNLSGGTFNVIAGVSGVGNIQMGQGVAQIQQQQINISGTGALNADRLIVNANVPSVGGLPMSVVSLTGGSLTVGDLAVPNNWSRNGLNGHVQLDGGIITVTKLSIADQLDTATGFRLANGPGTGAQSGNIVTGTMDITGSGVLKLTGDVTSIISSYLAAGSLTGFGSPANVVYDFNNTNPGFTTVKAMLGGTTDTTWTGSGDGTTWTSAGNWTSGVPTGLVAAHINGSPTVAINTGVNASAFKLNLAEAASSDNVTVNINAGTLTVGSANTALIGAKGRGTLNLSNGATVSTGPLQLGANDGEASARGTISVANSTLAVAGGIRMGVGNATTQTQELTVSGTSTVTASTLSLAETLGSVAQVTVSGGTLGIAGGTTNLGGAGTGTMTVSGGAVTLGGNLVMGASGTNAKGTLTISSGSLTMPGRTLVMGGSVSNTEVQTLNMSGGSLTASRLFVDDNTPSTGGPMAVVNMTGGSMSLGDLAIPTNWGQNGLSGHFNLDGGIVLVNNPSTGSTGATPSGFRIANGLDPLSGLNTVTGSMDITSGALILAGDATTLVQSYLTAGTLTGSAGAVLFDYNTTNPGYTTVHTAAFSGSITSRWTGAGDGSNWNVAGNWDTGVPNSGKIVAISGSPTVQVATGVTATAGSILLANVAGTDNVTLNVNGGSLSVGGAIPLGDKGRANLNVSNSGTVTTGDDLSLGATNGQASSRGTVVVNNGTLTAGRIRLGVGNATTQSQDFTLTAGTVTAPGVMNVAEQPGTVGNVTVTSGTMNVGTTNVGAKGTGTLTINGGTFHVVGVGGNGRMRIGGTSLADPTNGDPPLEVNAKGTVTIAGGNLIVDERILIGAARHATAVQTLNLSSGSLTATSLFVSDEADDVAVVNMTGGTMTLVNLGVPTNMGEANLDGTFNLHGGVVTISGASTGGTGGAPGGFRILNGLDPDGSGNTVHGKVDVTFGTFKLNGDALAIINPYIVTDKSLLAFGGTGIVLRDTTTNPGFTTVTAAVLGDANRDGLVNIFDINAISSKWNTPGPTGDVNGDSIVNIFDINAVSSHWLQTNPDGPTTGLAAANAVPEPASMISLAIGALLLAVRFRGKLTVR